MQKIHYINAFGESMTFSGEAPVLLRSVSGLSRPELEIVHVQTAHQPGAMISRLHLPMRRVQIRFDILPQENREAFYAMRMQMERVMSGSRAMREGQTGMLVYENDAGKWRIGAVPEGSIVYGRRMGHSAADNMAVFLCPNPYLFSDTKDSVQMRMCSGVLMLPTRLPLSIGTRRFKANLVNRGTADAAVTMTIYGTGETPEVVNHTTGARIAVSRQIAVGEKLVISTNPMALSCTLIRRDGSEEDAFGYLDPSLAVSAFVLIPGSNEIEYRPSVVSTGSRVEIEWQSCYEGV